MTSHDEIDDLQEVGFAALESGDLKAALRAGARLKELRHSSAFELIALAHAAGGDLDEAIAALDEGVSVAPSVWVLWQLLGNYRSDQRDFERAAEAYSRALECPGANPESVHYNRATALSRNEEFQEALDTLDLIQGDVEDERLRWMVVRVRMDVLNGLGRHGEAAGVGLASLSSLDSEVEPETAAGILAELGRGVWQGENDRDRAVAYALDAVRLHKDNDRAKWLLRELTGRVSTDGRHYRLLLHGDWMEADRNGEELSFFTTYHVVAESEGQAFEYAAAFEPREVLGSLTVEEAEVVAEVTDAPTGVYGTTGYSFYVRGSE